MFLGLDISMCFSKPCFLRRFFRIWIGLGSEGPASGRIPTGPAILHGLVILALLVVGLGSCQTTGVVEGDSVAASHGQQEFHDFKDSEFDESDEFDEFDEGDDLEVAMAGEVFDPLISYNRAMFVFNDKFFLWVWNPAAKGYNFVVPEVARVAVDRVFKNAATPVRFANDLLQLKFKTAGTELGRMLVNTTIGIGGLFDPAESFFGWRAPPPEDFGQTLGSYGVGTGFPVVVPFLGMKNLRDGLGIIPDTFLHPVPYYVTTPVSLSLAAGDKFNFTSLHIGEYESLKRDAFDPYTFFRDAYRQNRQKKIEE